MSLCLFHYLSLSLLVDLTIVVSFEDLPAGESGAHARHMARKSAPRILMHHTISSIRFIMPRATRESISRITASIAAAIRHAMCAPIGRMMPLGDAGFASH